MALGETVIEGTLKPDGTLELDKKPDLPAGRVTVVLRPRAETILPRDDAFWNRMRAMWDIPSESPPASSLGADVSDELRTMREEWHAHQLALERLQNDCRSVRKSPEEPTS
jgi:hypothetical protein